MGTGSGNIAILFLKQVPTLVLKPSGPKISMIFSADLVHAFNTYIVEVSIDYKARIWPPFI